MNIIKALLNLVFKDTEEETKPTKRTIEQTAWYHGYEAFEMNYSIHSNPYRKGGRLHQHWERGWYFAESVTRGNRK